MKKVFLLFIVSLFIVLLWSRCKDDEDQLDPVIPPPTLTGFSPISGAAGTVVILTGTNFSTTLSDNVVKFNSTPAIVTAATSTSITVTVPASAQTGKITVQVGNQVATSADDFTVILPVTLTSFSPTTGESGTIVTIIGTNFSTTLANNVVKFNDALATITSATATSLTVTAPAAGSTGKITVQIGTQIATSTDDFVYTSPSVTVSTLAGSGLYGFAEGDGVAAQFYQPTGVAVDASGNIYVADSENHRIRKITPTGTVSTLAGSATSGFINGNGSAAQFYSPRAVAVDADGNVYVADGINHSIRKITPTGDVSTLAGNGTSGFADGSGDAARFYFPKGLAIDADGNLYVADDINHRIRKVTPLGEVTTLAGSTSGYTDATGIAAQFHNPSGVAVDESGNVYVADAGNQRIRKITATGIVTTLAGSTTGFGEGAGASARFSGPVGLVVDASGNVYVADDENERIRKITSDGIVSTLAGGYLAGATNGSGEVAQFRSPTGLAMDAAGIIYVADRHNHSIRKISIE